MSFLISVIIWISNLLYYWYYQNCLMPWEEPSLDPSWVVLLHTDSYKLQWQGCIPAASTSSEASASLTSSSPSSVPPWSCSSSSGWSLATSRSSLCAWTCSGSRRSCCRSTWRCWTHQRCSRPELLSNRENPANIKHDEPQEPGYM